MILYIIPFVVTFFASLIFEFWKYPDEKSKFLIWIGIYFYLTLLIGLRYMVGGDSYSYMLYFENISSKSIFDFTWDQEYQPFFTILNNIAKSIYPSFTCFQIIHILIINTCLFYFIAKNSQFRFLTLFLCLLMFYINFTVEILRESLAIMVFVLNYKNFENNKWIKYYIGVLIAVMFHLSALFLIALPLFKLLKLNKYYIILLIITYFTLNRLNIIFTFFEDLENVDKKLKNYSEAYYGWKSTLLFFINRTLIPVIIFMWAKFKLKLTTKYESLICVFGLLGVCSIFNTIIFTRFTNYLMIFYCIALADIFLPYLKLRKLTSNKLYAVLTFIVVIITSSYTSFNWPTGYYEKWVPYYSVFSIEAVSNKIIDRNY